MSTFYNIAYAVGFTPWEKAGQADGDRIAWLFEREEVDRGGPGKALDLGCGSGLHAVTLAQRGWDVTGVDVIGKALDRARRRAAAAGVSATFVHADVTQLPTDTVGSGFDFFLDIGCFHGLDAQNRRAMARSVSARATPNATLVMLAFGKPVGPPFMPTGAKRSDIEEAYVDWAVVDVLKPPTDTPGLPKIARRSEPTLYRLARR